MKVAMLGWEFPPFVAGGLGVHCHEITRSLARLGVQVDFYMPAVEGRNGPLRVADRHKHLRIHEVPADAGAGPYGPVAEAYDKDFNRAVAAYNARLVDAFGSHDAQVLHCHDWITVPAALELRRRTGLPLVYTVHSTEHDRSAGWYPQDWIADIEAEGIQEADAVIAVSRYTQGLLERIYGADPEKTVAIHNGIDATPFRRRREYQDDRGTVLFLSRLCRQKGPLYFLQAAKRVLEVRPHTGFVMAGTGDMLEECIQYTIDNGLSDRVRFAGFVPEEELVTTYDENEVYVLPSVSEPFGISALEAMATGVPTIVSRTSGVAEATFHALKVEHGDVDEMAEMIIHVLDSPQLREELGRNGSREVARFDWDTCARRTLDTYRRIRRSDQDLHAFRNASRAGHDLDPHVQKMIP